MNKILHKLGTAILDVLVREISEQGVKWLFEKGKQYVSETIEKGEAVLESRQ